MIRDRIREEELDRATADVAKWIAKRLQEKGWGAFAGPHETYGIIAEEFKELLDELQANNPLAFRKELIDIAVACILGMASELPEDTSAAIEEGEEKS